MTFTDSQIRMLDAPLMREAVKTRSQSGRSLSYIEAWHAIAEANRIFGFDGWSRETVELRMVAETERTIGETKAQGWGVTYICRVRITAGEVIHDGCGAGHGIDRDLGQAHESALKEAESDAMKRALSCFGNQFGLALYDKTQANVADHSNIVYQRYVDDTRDTLEAFGDDHDGRVKWWNADAQKAARREMDLKAADLDMLKNLIISKAPKKTA